MSKNKKGMIVLVYRSSMGDCTNEGLSSKHNSFTLIDDVIDPVFEPNETRPELKVVRRQLFGSEYLHLEPVERKEGRGPMFGGNFAWTSDSRFRQKLSERPLPIHDRWENNDC